MAPDEKNTGLHETAKALVADDKGILAADESSGTIKKRFDSITLESTEENRRAYRDMLFTTPELEQFVTAILFDETIRQSSADGTPFPKLLADKGIIPGIKVDTGAQDLAGAPGEKVTEGLDGLRARLRGVPRPRRPLRQVARRDHDRGRNPDGVLHRDERPRTRPLRGALPGAGARADRRARGADGRRQRHRDVLPGDEADAAQDLRRALPPAGRPGGDPVCRTWSSPRAHRPRRARTRSPTGRSAVHETVPAAVPGIALSGGQSDEQASENLNAINSRGPQPWALSFSYGRPAGARPESMGEGRRTTSALASRSSRCVRAATAPRSPAATPQRWRSRHGRARSARRDEHLWRFRFVARCAATVPTTPSPGPRAR